MYYYIVFNPNISVSISFLILFQIEYSRTFQGIKIVDSVIDRELHFI
jgi:hypothetical protein